MKVRCTRLENLPDTEWLTKDKDYVVLSIFIDERKKIMYRLIGDDGRIPALYDSELFTVISSRVPSNWTISVEGDLLELAPQPWLEHNFWEDYFDNISYATNIFEAEALKIMTTEQ